MVLDSAPKGPLDPAPQHPVLYTRDTGDCACYDCAQNRESTSHHDCSEKAEDYRKDTEPLAGELCTTSQALCPQHAFLRELVHISTQYRAGIYEGYRALLWCCTIGR